MTDQQPNPSEDKKDDEKKIDERKVNYFDLYRFATCGDKALIAIGWLNAIVVGFGQPAVMIIFGETVDGFANAGKFEYCNDNNTKTYDRGICALTLQHMTESENNMMATMNENQTYSTDPVMDGMMENVWFFLAFGLGTWFCGYLQTATLMVSASRQTNVLRATYFRSIIRQDIAFFDTADTGELNTRMFDDVKKIQDGIGEKVGIAVQSAASFVGGMAIGFWYGPKLALVILAAAPFMAISGYFYFVVSTASTKLELDSYAKSGGVAEEVLSGIRTVTAFTGQKEELERYTKPLRKAEKEGIRKSALSGMAMGLTYLSMFCAYGLAFWYGGRLVLQEEYTVGRKLTVFFGVLIGAFGLSQFGDAMGKIATAQTAAFCVFEVIDRVPPIDTHSTSGASVKDAKGSVEFRNVSFTYPAREQQGVLKNVSFSVEYGKTTALCGQSGCGKSTCVQLIKRFYDPTVGSVLIDGRDLKELNVNSLRSIIGVVSQEPILFDTTVEENIKMGRLDVTKEEIIEAAKQANAFDFIQKLPEVWDTNVGEGGATLSGGQKQRIAIARALVRNPKILLLDEATSALDTESEALVQKALENASKGRTTIVIAHRLSTIRSADKIIGFHQGEVVEEGTHQTLMQIENGVYHNLCNMQTFANPDLSNGKVPSVLSVDGKELNTTPSIKNVESEVKGDEPKEEVPEAPYMQIMKLNRPEWHFMIIAAIMAFTTGALQPLFAMLFADVLDLYGKYNCALNKKAQNATGDFISSFFENETFNAEDIKNGTNGDKCDVTEFEYQIAKFAIGFCLLGVGNFITFCGSFTLFGLSGERLTTRLRRKSFKKLLQLEIGFFDQPVNSTGALAMRLSTDASKVQGATGAQIHILVKSVGAFLCGFGIAFYYEWRLTLFCLAFVPVMIVTFTLMMDVFTGKVGEKEQKAMEAAGAVTTECTINIRTVQGLGRENEFALKYEENIKKPLATNIKKINWYGCLYGASLGILFMMYAGIFWFASWLITKGILDAGNFPDIFRVLFAIVFAAMTMGEDAALAPDLGEAKTAASRVISLLNRKSEIDPENDGGMKPEECRGDITFENVNFRYPTRPDVKVLSGLNIKVKAGETLALVGQSGCGKSTCIQLLERFYDGSAGNILIDGNRISELNVKWLRQQIGFVQQEPILFDKTIKENIIYGLDLNVKKSGAPPSTQQVGILNDNVDDAIEAAAKEANAFNFVQELPDKFNTGCGKKGSQLSGGQKQRIAIARALVRHPKILLLDEATSALDAESEKLVQEALNSARKGRTCILIAHRLSTVINADKIAVVDNGMITEVGTHNELIAKKGAYYSLVNTQL